MMDVVGRFEQLGRYAALRLEQRLGTSVTVVTPRSLSDAAARQAQAAATLTADGRLALTLRVPGARCPSSGHVVELERAGAWVLQVADQLGQEVRLLRVGDAPMHVVRHRGHQNSAEDRWCSATDLAPLPNLRLSTVTGC